MIGFLFGGLVACIVLGGISLWIGTSGIATWLGWAAVLSLLGGIWFAISATPLAEKYQLRAERHNSVGRKAEALADFEKALKEGPSNSTKQEVEAAIERVRKEADG